VDTLADVHIRKQKMLQALGTLICSCSLGSCNTAVREFVTRAPTVSVATHTLRPQLSDCTFQISVQRVVSVVYCSVAT